MPKKRIIYSRKIMLQLIEAGIFPIETIKNPYKPQFWSWVFDDTEELEQQLDRIFAIRGEKNGR